MKLERITLANQERIIERGLGTFVQVGEALANIRDAKLYRDQGYATFSDYCKERWGWNSSRARQLIAAADTQGSVTNVTLSNEGQARELRRAPEDERSDVMAKVQANGEVTAKAIRNEVGRRQGRVPEPGPECSGCCPLHC